MVLMRARESFEDLEKRYNTKQPKAGPKSGMAAIMICDVGRCLNQWFAWEERHEVTHEVDGKPEL
jgi:hypothetical protein